MLRIHCDGCDRALLGSACASLSPQVTTAVTDAHTCTVSVDITRAEHLCHECRKRILNAAIEEIVIAQWWDPK